MVTTTTTADSPVLSMTAFKREAAAAGSVLPTTDRGLQAVFSAFSRALRQQGIKILKGTPRTVQTGGDLHGCTVLPMAYFNGGYADTAMHTSSSVGQQWGTPGDDVRQSLHNTQQFGLPPQSPPLQVGGGRKSTGMVSATAFRKAVVTCVPAPQRNVKPADALKSLNAWGGALLRSLSRSSTPLTARAIKGATV
jgi:hypothetical protein